MGACFSTEPKEQPKKQPNEHQYIRFEANNPNGQKPLCYFAPNCKRQNTTHHREFSHNMHNYNGTIASNDQCCRVYQTQSSQSFRGGGCVSSFQEPINESIVKNAGCAIITSGSIVFVVENCSGKLNFPCGKSIPNESSLSCAFRETEEELGFNPFQSGIHLNHKWTLVRSHTSSKTGKKSQSVIYVFDHSKPAEWFNHNFRSNDECSNIFVMSIKQFVEEVKNRSTIFRYPESMKQFVEQLKERKLI